MQLSTTPLPSRRFALSCALAGYLLAPGAHAVTSGELYTNAGSPFGRFEARVQFAGGDGVVSSFFLWKDGSEVSGTFWNELDFEKVEADCHLETNALYGDPESTHSEAHALTENLCGTFHTYTYEWTPEYIAWFIDGVEIRRETGDISDAYRDNATEGMQIRFNVWPGDASFGGDFDPAVLPVHQYVNWVQFSSYVDGVFELQWREDFSGPARPSGWSVGSWPSPKNLSTHSAANVSFMDGYAVISLTADDATGPAGATPLDPDDSQGPPGGSAGAAGAAGGNASGEESGGESTLGERDRDGSGGCSVQTAAHANAPGGVPSWAWLAVAAGACLRRRQRAPGSAVSSGSAV